MFVVPGLTTEMTPPQLQVSLLLLFNAGELPIKTVVLPGAHGAVVTGMHGIGVKTPMAAAVAEATVGFDIELHIPNGMIFAIGLLSIIVAIGIVVIVLLFGSTFMTDGAMPKVHCKLAPPQTQNPIFSSLSVQ
jgi:hypothetical protein